MNITLDTERLRLRQWHISDLPLFTQLNADPRVMQYFPKILNFQESNALAEKFKSLIQQNGWGFWAAELKKDRTFIGFVGLHYQPSQFEFSPCVEIGWRLAYQFWNKGYATEAANACLAFAFDQLELESIVAFTTVGNHASERVMQRLGMHYVQNFMHPALKSSHPLAEHILYQITRAEFQTEKSQRII
ncbi:GNAT family N-acetyltransferase [Acinetobacter stercoris]|uniref:Putative ribosomal N-acetyltransferase YdaF n=1 Tax=Acinetobacter stercoris TaxID=2126983 RepID=A0A2U3N489_9GAMM|nr:GNAT family N-acetyltransferase [Acinetobacter stercoris]SPL72496.1 putative ribosomal N-acetyltransferase YdaF [Acinetobacter stercoris]